MTCEMSRRQRTVVEQPSLFDAPPTDPWGMQPDPGAAHPTSKPSRSHKPAWLAKICAKNNPQGLKAVRCSCGAWTVQQQPRHGVWDSYDPYIVTGGQVVCARILGIILDKFTWDSVRRCAVITTTMTPSADGTYLQCHCCGRPPLSDMGPELPTRSVAREAVQFPYHGSSAEDVAMFERVWHAPIGKLVG